MGRKSSAKGERKRSGKGGKLPPSKTTTTTPAKVVGLSSEGFWDAASEPSVGGVRLYGNSKLPPPQPPKDNVVPTTAPVNVESAAAEPKPTVDVAPADRRLLDACKTGNADGVSAALQLGASATLGLKFMFKVIDLFDTDVTTKIVLLLKEAQKGETATC